MKIELTPDEVELFRKSLDDTTFKWLIGFEKRLGKLERLNDDAFLPIATAFETINERLEDLEDGK